MNADDGLSADNFGGLNSEFYSAKPHDHIAKKVQLLLLLAGRRDDIESLLREGVSFDRIELSFDTSVESPDSERDQAHWEYLTIEAETVYMHAVETLLRLYLAHEEHPECPWLEVSRLRAPSAFKSAVESRFLSDSLSPSEKLSRLHPVVVGVSPQALEGGDERLYRILTAIEESMETFAGDLINGAARYNSVKHGLAVQANEQALRVSNDQYPEIMAADGQALTYLEIRDVASRDEESQSRRWKWFKVTSWIDIDSRLSATMIAA